MMGWSAWEPPGGEPPKGEPTGEPPEEPKGEPKLVGTECPTDLCVRVHGAHSVMVRVSF